MSQIGRPIKSLEAPRPLKSISRQAHHNPIYEVQSIEELITLTENLANALSMGQSNADSMSILLSNLRVHGPQLEMISKDTLDRAFVTFRNASQDERLSIISRMNLLELIELRAKSWQISDGINTYYKHKATDVQPDNSTAIIDLTLLGTSPPSSGLNQTTQILSPGELIRTSGKFTKPTKIPGKNYSKDEVVIRNADSGKVMGIKGRRVHMIEELSETIISFQRVNPGAKERLVQITGPNEDKINHAKQLIEDTIRRNASPVRLEAPAGGSCSSLASSASDETTPRANRNSLISASGVIVNNNVPNQNFSNNSIGVGVGGISGGVGSMGNNGLTLKMPRTSAGQTLFHSLSTNDASLGEYKYTVVVGHHNIKITGDCCELVQIAKLVLDDYFSSKEFLASIEAGASFDAGIMHSSSTVTTPTTPLSMSSIIPASHQLNTSSPFADSGIGLNNNNSVEIDDDVFIVENTDIPIEPPVSITTSAPVNGLTRSRRSHFSRKDSTPESIVVGSTSTSGGHNKEQIVRFEYERLMYYAKSPHSWALPRNWSRICDQFPAIVRNKVKTMSVDTYPTNNNHHNHHQNKVNGTNNAYNHSNFGAYNSNNNYQRKGFLSRTASVNSSFDVITID